MTPRKDAIPPELAFSLIARCNELRIPLCTLADHWPDFRAGKLILVVRDLPHNQADAYFIDHWGGGAISP